MKKFIKSMNWTFHLNCKFDYCNFYPSTAYPATKNTFNSVFFVVKLWNCKPAYNSASSNCNNSANDWTSPSC